MTKICFSRIRPGQSKGSLRLFLQCMYEVTSLGYSKNQSKSLAHNMEAVGLTPEKVKEVLGNLNTSKSTSADGMLLLFLKETTEEISYTLQIFFFKTVGRTIQYHWTRKMENYSPFQKRPTTTNQSVSLQYYANAWKVS